MYIVWNDLCVLYPRAWYVFGIKAFSFCTNEALVQLKKTEIQTGIFVLKYVWYQKFDYHIYPNHLHLCIHYMQLFYCFYLNNITEVLFVP